MPIGSSKIGVLGAGLVPGGSVTFNAPGTYFIPPGVKKVNITGRGGTGNPGGAGNAGNAGTFGTGGAGGGGGGGILNGPCGVPQPLGFGASGVGGGPSINAGAFACWQAGNNIPAPLKAGAGGTSGFGKPHFPPVPVLSGNPGGAGASGAAGSGGSAGSAGASGNPGNASTGLTYNFAGGAGGSGGAAGNAGTGGTGGGGGGGGNKGTSVITGGNGGAGGTGGGAGGSGDTYCYPTAKPPDPTGINRGRFGYGGGGGGGAGTTNSGNSGRTPNEWSPAPSQPNSYRNQPVNSAEGWCRINTAACGIGGEFPGFNFPTRSPPIGNPPINTNWNRTPSCNGGGQWGPPNRFGGPGRATQSFTGGFITYVCRSGTRNPNLGPTNEVYRSGSGGGQGGCAFLRGNALSFNPCFGAAAGGGGGGGGRGNAGNAGGAGGAGNPGAAGTPQTFNCEPVTPGGSAPITVASPGGQVVISWNPQ